MLENYIYTKNYISQYIKYIKEYKLKSDYIYKKKITLGYEEFFDKNKKYLDGGNIQETSEKMEKINSMFQKFNETTINTQELKEKYLKFQKHIDNISLEIDKINFDDLNIDRIKNDDLTKIITSFNEDNKINEHIQDIAYFKKKEIQFFDKNGQNSINKILEKVKLTFDNLNQKKIQEDESKKIFDELNIHLKLINENLEKIGEEVTLLQKENSDFEEYLKFKFADGEIEFVQDDDKTINPVLNSTKTIKNGFLEFDSKIETMTSSVAEIKKLSGGKNIKYVKQKGGEFISIENSTKIIDLLNNIQLKINLFNNKTKDYKKILDKVNSNNKYKTGYLLFMVALTVDKVKNASTYFIFEYIGRNTINYYLKIVNDIITNEEKNSNPIRISSFNYTRDYIVLYKLKYFLLEIQKKIVAEEKDIRNKSKKKINLYVNIKKCSGNTRNMFVLLNNYKSILEEYKISALNKVSIYSRINDISREPIPMEKKFFMSAFDKSDMEKKANEEESPYDMFIYSNTTACKDLICIEDKKEDKKEKKCDIDGKFMKYKFSEVFDSSIYSDNNDLSQYMSLNTLLSNKSDSSDKKNGIVLMTYGYSGTGKTFTLFGSSNESNKTTGILQSTLKTINGLLSVRFRLYEVYGFGLPYPHFWKNKEVSKYPHDIVHYKLEKKDNSHLTFSDIEIHSGENFSNFVKDYERNKNSTTYTLIDGSEIQKYFENFDSLVDRVEKFRENNIAELKDVSNKIPEHKRRRVRDTNNNDVSSRSILIYDFMIEMTNGSFIPFLIIDLPGREEIVGTFIEPYFGNDIIKELYAKGSEKLGEKNSDENFDKAKMLFLMMALNPMGISLYCYNDILIFFTKEIKTQEEVNFFGCENAKDAEEVKKEIFNTKLFLEYDFNPLELAEDKKQIFFISENKIIGKMGDKGFVFIDEIINYKGGDLNVMIEIKNNNISFKDLGQHKSIKGYSTEDQRKALVCAHLINRIIMMNKLDILYNIYKIISEKYLNRFLLEGLKYIGDGEINAYCKKLIDSNFKAIYLKKKLDLIKEDDVVGKRELLVKMIPNDYYLSPFEGVYINENIAGIIKYLSTHEALIPDEKKRLEQEKKLELTSKQDFNLDFQKQQKKLRLWLYDNIDKIDLKDNQMNNYKYADIAYFFYMKDDLKGCEECEKWFGTKPFENKIIKDTQKTNKVNELAKQIIPKQIFLEQKDINIEYEKVAKSYESDKIFNFENPTIKQVIEPYIADITDYKILYLFGNYGDDNMRNMKCKNQFNLLEKTKDFITNIVGE
jgi:hypothetical protein